MRVRLSTGQEMIVRFRSPKATFFRGAKEDTDSSADAYLSHLEAQEYRVCFASHIIGTKIMISRFLLVPVLFGLFASCVCAQTKSPLDKFKEKMDELKPSGKLLRQILGQDEEPEPPKKPDALPTAAVRTPAPPQLPQPAANYRGQPPLANYQPSLAKPVPDRARSSNGLGLITEATGQGLKVALVRAGSPADRAGIKVDDRIIKFAGIGVESEEELNEIAGALRQGDQIEVSISRDGKPYDLVVTFGEAAIADENIAAALKPANAGNSDAVATADALPSSVQAMQDELLDLRQTVKQQAQVIYELQQRLRAVQAGQFRGR